MRKIHNNIRQQRGKKALQTKRAKFHADTGFVQNLLCKFWHPPVCQHYKSETGCIYGRKGFFRHVEADGQPSKKVEEKRCEGPVAFLKESIHLGCVSQDSHPRKFVLREEGKLGSTHSVIFSNGTWHQVKILERKGPSQGIIPKCESHERSRCAPKFEERCARRVPWDWA